MNEIALAIVCIALILFCGYVIYQSSEDRKRMIKALLAKDLQEFDVSEKIEHEPRVTKKESDELPLESMPDDKFHQMIQTQLKRSQDGQE